MKRPLKWYDTITINIYFTGLTSLSQTMTPLVLPLLIQQFVGEEKKATYYGTIRLWSLMIALLVQSLMGMISDRSTSKFGRRRPFILIGTIIDIILIIAISFTTGLEGLQGFWILFILMLLLMVSANTAHAAAQGLIPDLVPEDQRGIFSGVKSLLEVPIPLIIVPFTIGAAISAGNLFAGILILCAILLVTALITMFVPETQYPREKEPINWEPFLRLFLMTALFTGIILAVGFLVRQAGSFLGATELSNSIILMTLLGLVGMLLAVGIGVHFCVKVGVGTTDRSNQPFTWWIINRLSFLIGSTNIASFAVFFLQGRLGLERELAVAPATRLIMIVGIFVLILAIPSGWLADKIGKKSLVGLSGALAVVGTVILISSPSMVFIYIGGILIGSAAGLFYTSNWALGTLLVPKDSAGHYLGISNLAGAGAGAVGAYIGGPIADYFTNTFPNFPGLGYVVLFSIYGMLFLFSIFALSKIKLGDHLTPG